MSDGDNWLTFLDPSDTHRFTPGMRIVTAMPWHARLWRWFKFRVLRQPRDILTVAAVDYSGGHVTVTAGTERP